MNTRSKVVIKRILPYILLILVAVLTLAPQLRSHAFVSGLDYYFHMSRTYETAMQIKTGHFSYFLSLFSWDHNARIVNALYGPVGGYLSGIILLFAHSWYRWEITVSLLTLILAGFMMYHLGRYWHVNRAVDFLISILYILSAPVSDFVFKQTLAGFTSALVPLIVLMVSEVLVQHDIKPIKLALILWLIIEIHLMTFFISMTFLIPCLLIGFVTARKTRESLIKHAFEAAGLTIVLSFNVWGSVLEIFGSNFHHIIPTMPGTIIGVHDFNAIMNTYPRTPLLQTPSVIGLAVMILIAFTVILWLFNLRWVNYIVDIFMLFGLAFIWASSSLFPWRIIRRHFSYVITLIQFPKRFLPLGIIIIYLLLEVLLSKDIQNSRVPRTVPICALVALCLFVGWCWQNNYNYLAYKINTYKQSPVIDWVSMRWRKGRQNNRLRKSFQSDQPGQFFGTVGKPIPDYLPTGTVYHSSEYNALDPYDRYYQTFYHHIPYHWTVLKHGQEMITINARNNRFQTVPFVKYAHTEVTLNHHPIDPPITKIGAMQVPLRKGLNQISIRYQPSHWFEIGMLISLLVWVALFISIFVS